MVDQYQENGIGQFYTGLKGNCVELFRYCPIETGVVLILTVIA